jgi:hypothetical protein
MARSPAATAVKAFETKEPERGALPQSLATGVEHPFRVTLEHGPVDHRAMFRIAETLDFYEVVGIQGENRGKDRRPLTIDVIELNRTQTVMHVTPSRSVPYPEMSAELDHIVEGANKRLFGGTAKVSKIEWNIGKTGIASDMRGRLRPVM